MHICNLFSYCMESYKAQLNYKYFYKGWHLLVPPKKLLFGHQQNSTLPVNFIFVAFYKFIVLLI